MTTDTEPKDPFDSPDIFGREDVIALAMKGIEGGWDKVVDHLVQATDEGLYAALATCLQLGQYIGSVGVDRLIFELRVWDENKEMV